jgi:hypothetical protein
LFFMLAKVWPSVLHTLWVLANLSVFPASTGVRVRVRVRVRVKVRGRIRVDELG